MRYLDIITLIIFILWVRMYKQKTKKIALKIEAESITTADYSAYITGLPK